MLSLLALALPCLAIVVSLGRTGLRAGGGVRRWASGSARRAAFAFGVAAALVGFAAYTWWPNGDYEPLRPGERGTVGEALGAVALDPERPAGVLAGARGSASARRRPSASASGGPDADADPRGDGDAGGDRDPGADARGDGHRRSDADRRGDAGGHGDRRTDRTASRRQPPAG